MTTPAPPTPSTPAPTPAPTQAKMVEVPDGYSFVPFLSLQQEPKPPFEWASDYAQKCNAEKNCAGYNSAGQGFNSEFKKKIHYVRGDPTRGSYFKRDTDYNFFCKKIGGEPTGNICKTPPNVNDRIEGLINAGMVVEPFVNNSWGIHPLMLLVLIVILVWVLQQMKK